MNNPAVYTLAALQIAAARAASLLTPQLALDGMSALSIEANFQWGSGGATCTPIVCTSFDGGVTWRQIARFDFATASAVKTVNLQALSARAISAYADLNAEGINDGLLGDRLAVLLTSTGTYATTTLSIRAAVR